jgi:hypothetical protein
VLNHDAAKKQEVTHGFDFIFRKYKKYRSSFRDKPTQLGTKMRIALN